MKTGGVCCGMMATDGERRSKVEVHYRRVNVVAQGSMDHEGKAL